jgi:DNA-binding MarR family transcriptional regulator
MPTNDESPLASTLLTFSRTLRARHAELLAPHGLHPGQDALLMALWREGGLRQSDLALRLGVEPPTITRMVQRLERGGLIDRRPDPDDARAMRLHATPRARLLEGVVRRVWAELDALIVEAVGGAEAARLGRTLGAVLRSWGDPAR